MTQFFEPLFQPIGLLWLLHTIAAVWMARRRQWREMAFCGTVAVGIFLIGSTPLPAQLLASLERRYANQRLDKLPVCDAVVMLGGTLSASRADLLGFDLGEGADRVFTAIELFHEKKAGALILGGGGGQRKLPPHVAWSEGELLEPWLARWSGTNTNFLHLRNCSNTREEALQIAVLAKERHWQRIILVTSGYHMKRAAALFGQLGVPAESVACDFIGLSSLENQRPFSPFPQLIGFHHLELFLHEWLGWFYYRGRGWV